MLFPQLAAKDSIVEPHSLGSAKAKREVDGVPDFKVPFAWGYTVSICFVVNTSILICFMQRTNYGIVWFNKVISNSAFIVCDNQ